MTVVREHAENAAEEQKQNVGVEEEHRNIKEVENNRDD